MDSLPSDFLQTGQSQILALFNLANSFACQVPSARPFFKGSKKQITAYLFYLALEIIS